MVIKAVVFDFGGVIMNYGKVKELFHEMAQEFGVDKEIFFEKSPQIWKVFTSENRLMTGQITAEHFEEQGFLDGLNQVFGKDHKTPIRWLRKLNSPDYIQYNESMLDFIKHLKEHGFKLGLLTNNFFIDKEKKLESTPIDRSLFDAIVESRLEGIEKPNPKIYEVCHSRIQISHPHLEPSEILFLDDVEINISVAQEFGWKTIHVSRKDPNTAILRTVELIRAENGIHFEFNL